MLRSLLGSTNDAVGGDVPCCRRQQVSVRRWCTATRLNGAIPNCHRALESTQTHSAVSARLLNSCGCRLQWRQHRGLYMEVRGQPHAPAALPPAENFLYSLDRRQGCPQSQSGRFGERINLLCLPGFEHVASVVQSITSTVPLTASLYNFKPFSVFRNEKH